jgi:hypothetical protein
VLDLYAGILGGEAPVNGTASGDVSAIIEDRER